MIRTGHAVNPDSHAPGPRHGTAIPGAASHQAGREDALAGIRQPGHVTDTPSQPGKTGKNGLKVVDDVTWGSHFCRFYETKLHLPQTRVIALSMSEEAQISGRMRRAGAEMYLLKTAPSEQLLLPLLVLGTGRRLRHEVVEHRQPCSSTRPGTAGLPATGPQR